MSADGLLMIGKKMGHYCAGGEGRSRDTYWGSGLEGGFRSGLSDGGWDGDCQSSAGEDGDELGEMHFGFLGVEVDKCLER